MGLLVAAKPHQPEGTRNPSWLRSTLQRSLPMDMSARPLQTVPPAVLSHPAGFSVPTASVSLTTSAGKILARGLSAKQVDIEANG